MSVNVRVRTHFVEQNLLVMMYFHKIANVFNFPISLKQLTVNQLVVGSIPTAGAKNSHFLRYLRDTRVGKPFWLSFRVTIGVTKFF